MSDYDRHGDLVLRVQTKAETRCAELAKELKEAFQGFIRLEAVEVVFFSEMSAADLASAFLRHSSVLKPVLTSCNIAARAIERDLDIRNVDTYKPKLTEQQANLLAGLFRNRSFRHILPCPRFAHLISTSILIKRSELRKGDGKRESSNRSMSTENPHSESEDSRSMGKSLS